MRKLLIATALVLAPGTAFAQSATGTTTGSTAGGGSMTPGPSTPGSMIGPNASGMSGDQMIKGASSGSSAGAPGASAMSTAPAGSAATTTGHKRHHKATSSPSMGTNTPQ